MTANIRPYLRLVRASQRTRDDALSAVELRQVQEPLLPPSDLTVAVATADAIDGALLTTLIADLRPTHVVDFRTVPRFDFGPLNRRRTFDLMADVGARYHDLGHAVTKAADATSAVVGAVSRLLMGDQLGGKLYSVLLFVDAGVDFEKTGLAAIQELRERTKRQWELILFGPIIQADTGRSVLFISHANPEDNEFVLWLQTQLTRLGYSTWSDLTELGPGDVFWDSIEDVIRRKAARVIAVVSRRSVQKPNVLDEISLAISVERTQGIKGFVIPVRVDDLPFSDLRANIARKNVLDFAGSWASGLNRLADALSREQIPKARNDEGLSLSAWWAQQKQPALAVVQSEEILVSNRFRVRSLPKRIHTFSGTPVSSSTDAIVAIPFSGLWLSYLSRDELRGLGVEGLVPESILSAADLFAGNLALTSHMSFASRQRLLHRILNKQWQGFLLSRGLRLYTETGIQPTPYIPDGLVPDNTAHFVDEDGKVRRRILVGYSTKRNLFWHLAPRGSFSSGEHVALNLSLRVLFSEDGQNKWPSVDRMRTMRRAFCRNWWNDRWRALQMTLMSWLSSGTDLVSVYEGEGGVLSISSTPIGFRALLAIDEEQARSGDGQEDLALKDEHDDEQDLWDELEPLLDSESGPDQGAGQ